VVMAAGIAFVQANLGGPVFRALFASSTTALTPFYVILAVRREAVRCRVEVRCLDHWAVAAA